MSRRVDRPKSIIVYFAVVRNSLRTVFSISGMDGATNASSAKIRLRNMVIAESIVRNELRTLPDILPGYGFLVPGYFLRVTVL